MLSRKLLAALTGAAAVLGFACASPAANAQAIPSVYAQIQGVRGGNGPGLTPNGRLSPNVATPTDPVGLADMTTAFSALNTSGQSAVNTYLPLALGLMAIGLVVGFVWALFAKGGRSAKRI